MNTEELIEVVLPGKVEPEGLQIRHGVVPAPGPGQVVIRMEATGVSFAEQQMRRGRYYDQPAFPFVPGYDLVGAVQATGEGVEPDLTGTRVAALVNVERAAQPPPGLLLQRLGRTGPGQEPVPGPVARRPHPGLRGPPAR